MKNDSKYQAVGHRILVRLDDVEQQEKTKSGIIIAKEDASYKREQVGMERGTVLDIGPTAYTVVDDGTSWVKKGDRICFARYEGVLLTEEDDEGRTIRYRMINDTDVFAKIAK